MNYNSIQTFWLVAPAVDFSRSSDCDRLALSRDKYWRRKAIAIEVFRKPLKTASNSVWKMLYESPTLSLENFYPFSNALGAWGRTINFRIPAEKCVFSIPCPPCPLGTSHKILCQRVGIGTICLLEQSLYPVSYTHLTLPTIYSV